MQGIIFRQGDVSNAYMGATAGKVKKTFPARPRCSCNRWI